MDLSLILADRSINNHFFSCEYNIPLPSLLHPHRNKYSAIICLSHQVTAHTLINIQYKQTQRESYRHKKQFLMLSHAVYRWHRGGVEVYYLIPVLHLPLFQFIKERKMQDSLFFSETHTSLRLQSSNVHTVHKKAISRSS